MKTIRNIVAFLIAPYCLEVEVLSDALEMSQSDQYNVFTREDAIALEMSQRYKYRFFTRDDAIGFVEDWQGPSMMFRVYRRSLFTDKA